MKLRFGLPRGGTGPKSLVATLGSRFLLLVVGRAVVLGLALVATAILTRTLGPAGFGNDRAAAGYFGLVVMLADPIGGALALSALAPEIIRLLAGAAFADAAMILRLLTIVFVLHAVVVLLREAATALQIQHRLLPGYLLGLASYAVLLLATRSLKRPAFEL